MKQNNKPKYFDRSFRTIYLQSSPNSTWKDHQYVHLFAKLYDQHILKNFNCSEKERIPKIIHQTWFSGEVPKSFFHWKESWKREHPDWEYILWTKEKIEALDMINKDLFFKAKNIATKADIARYEILYQYGGLYADMDTECLKPFDLFHHCCDFYVGYYDYAPCMDISIMGSRPRHPLLKAAVYNLRYSDVDGNDITSVINNTGPMFFLKSFLQTIHECNDRVVVFPPAFFFPFPISERFSGAKASHPIVNRFLQDYSYSIHYWGNTWVKDSETKSDETLAERIQLFSME